MNIQVFGKSKSFDTRKAERWFKERRIKYQYIDLVKYGMSRGELKSVSSSAGLDNIIDWSNENTAILKYLASAEAKLDKLYEYPELLITPIVRNGKQATAGYKPDVWETWE